MNSECCLSSSVESSADPLLANLPFEHSKTFQVLGFCIRVATNAAELLTVLTERWTLASDFSVHSLTLRVGITAGGSDISLSAPVVRADDHQLSIIADARNFIICNLDRGSAFGWITQATLERRSYLQYSLIDAAAKCLISTSHATPIHAACVSRRERGFLLCGTSGAGKSTLAYACARSGWTYTSDDASYLLWQTAEPWARGNHQLCRFRLSSSSLFPELASYRETLRPEGKPSIEVLTSELCIEVAPEAKLSSIIFLDRRDVDSATLTRLVTADCEAYFTASLFASGEIRSRQAEALQKLGNLDKFRLTYCELTAAIECLEELACKY